MPGGFVVPPPGAAPAQTGLNPANEPSSLPPGVSAATAPQSPINQVLQQHGIEPLSATSLTAEALRSLLEQAGADVNDTLPTGMSAMVLATHSGHRLAAGRHGRLCSAWRRRSVSSERMGRVVARVFRHSP